MGYSLSGEVRWGPNASCEVDESGIDGYQAPLPDLGVGGLGGSGLRGALNPEP